ncbi:hypothetical protein A8B73_21470 [Methylosinus sp. 3S-1]|nr:hypothetical protein A8B73_21470 [Methylosinus sp. 3S-1]
MIIASAPPRFAADGTFDPTAFGKVVADRSDEGDRQVVIGDARGEIHVWMNERAPSRPAIILPLDASLEIRLEVASRFVRRLQGGAAGPLPRALQLTAQRRTRLILLLHALDFRLGGAGPRDIAASLIDAEDAELPALEWKSSATRRKANRLIHDSIALMNGGYKRLLRGG